jgi:uncharacterized protein (DUF58 family)
MKNRTSKGFRRPPRRAIPTRAGLFALSAPIVLGVAAVNASNNLLFILLGGVLGSIVLSGILSERNMRGVKVNVRSVSQAYAGEPAKLLVGFERDRELPAAFALRVREIRPGGLLAYLRSFPRGLEVHLPLLDGRRAERVGTRIFDRRGPAEVGACELTTRYPFGLLIKARDAEVDVGVLVRPKRIPAPRELADPRGIASDGEVSERRGQGIDLYGLRERDDRDAMQRVHALRSLSLGRDVVIETAGVERPIAVLGLSTASSADPEAFERALELAQAVLIAWDERGYAVGLETSSESFAPGEHSLDALLDRLATLAPAEVEKHEALAAGLWIVPAGAPRPLHARAVAAISHEGVLEVRA